MVLVTAEEAQQRNDVNTNANEASASNLITPTVPIQSSPSPKLWNFTVEPKYTSRSMYDDMKTILSDKNLSEDMKYVRWQDAFQRLRATSTTSSRAQSAYIRPRSIYDEIDMDVEQLLRVITEVKKKNARMLINFLTSLRQFSVNAQYEIQLYGEPIEDSNIHTLLKEITNDRKTPTEPKPIGHRQLMNLLVESNVPLAAIGNLKYRQQISMMSHAEEEEEEEEPQPEYVGNSPLNDTRTPSSVNSSAKQKKKKKKAQWSPNGDDDSSDNERRTTPSSVISSGYRAPTSKKTSIASKQKKKEKKAQSYSERRKGSKRQRRQWSPSGDSSASDAEELRNVYIRGVKYKEGNYWKDYTNTTST